jgi:hypothetical protein
VKQDEDGQNSKSCFTKENKGGGRNRIPAAFKAYLVE